MSIHLWEPVAEPSERFPACHCSVVLGLDNRDLLVGYYAGSGEAKPDTAYGVAKRRSEADAFDPLRVVADTPGKPEGNGFGTEYKDGNSRIWASGDEGETWKVVGSVPGERNQHPSLIERSDGSILALLRPSGGQRCVLQSVSTDAGRTWSPAERTSLPSPFAALDAVRLSDGRVALAWNRNPEARNPLTLALSIDHLVLTPDWITGQGEALPPWDGTGRRLQ